MPTYINPAGTVDATNGDDTIIFNAPWQPGTVVDALGGNDDLFVQIDDAGPLTIDVSDEFDAGYFNLDIRLSPFSPLYVFNVENVELHGTANDDSFRLQIGLNSSALTAFMDGGAGQDLLIFNWSKLTTGMTFVVNGASISSSFGTFTSFEIFSISAGPGNDTITTGGGDDLVYTGTGVDNVSTGAGNDSIESESSGGTIAAGDGDDFISLIGPPNPSVSVNGGSGQDILQVNWSGVSAAISFVVNGTTITSNAGSFANLESFFIQSGSGDDTITTGGGDDVIWTGDGNDTISGGAGDDSIAAGGGDDVVNAGEGNDGLSGLDGADQLDGGDGDDQIYGQNGNDHLEGGSGADTIYGDDSFTGDGDGDDIINGGLGNDLIRGGGGNDTISGGDDADEISGGMGSDFIDGGDGNDHLNGVEWGSSEDDGPDVLLGGNGDDHISAGIGDEVNGGSGTDTLYYYAYFGATEGVTADFSALTGGGTITVAGATLSGIEYISGIILTAYDDVVVAGAVPGVQGIEISGWGGDDDLTGSTGVDMIYGGDGNDVIRGGVGINPAISPSLDRLFGEAGDDVIYIAGDGALASGGIGNDTVHGGSAADDISGDDGADTLYGAGGNDGLVGGSGDDYLDGGTGADVMYGGEGNDTYVVDDVGDVASESAYGGGGTDLVLSSVSLALGDGLDNLTLVGGAISGTGNLLNNVLTGNDASNTLIGLGGNDQMFGGDGNDRLDGGVGNDLLHGGNGIDTADYRAALAAITVSLAIAGAQNTGGAGSDTLTAIENVEGSAYNDRMTGNANANGLFGGGGNDTLVGGGGDDELDGGAGNDMLNGGAGLDVASYTGATTGVVVNLALTAAQNTVGAGVDTLTGIENLLGSNHSDRLTGNDAANSLSGLDGADKLYGGGGNDALDGGSGDDYLYGELGNDTLTGGAGYDRMYGGVGDDTYLANDATDFAYELVGEGTDLVIASIDHQLRDHVENLTLTGSAVVGKGNALGNQISGNAGINKLYGYDGDDTLDGGQGDDYVSGGNGNDTLIGGAGYDKLYGNTGDDTFIVTDATDFAYENAGEGYDTVVASSDHRLRDHIEELELIGTADIRGYGNAENNLITGNSGSNLLYGRDGNDTLRGEAGNDLLYGENGNDRLDGGAGQDRYYGGAGADQFIFDDGDFAGPTPDRIMDFSQAEGDLIDLFAVDANSGLAGDQGFSFIGAGAFTGAAGELRTFQAGGMTYLQGDTNGDGAADFLIRIDGLHNLQGSDLLI